MGKGGLMKFIVGIVTNPEHEDYKKAPIILQITKDESRFREFSGTIEFHLTEEERLQLIAALREEE